MDATTTQQTATATEVTQGQQATTQQAASTAWHSGILGDDGSFAPKWQEKLPDGLKEYAPLAGQFNSLGGLFKALNDNMTAARAKATGVQPIGEQSTPEEIAAFRQAFGIPDQPYTIEKPEKLPDGVEFDEGMAKQFGEFAHSINLTPAQVEKIRAWHEGSLSQQFQARSLSQKAEMEQLIAGEKEELTKQFGAGLDSAVTKAARAAQALGLPADEMNPAHDNFVGVRMLGAFARMADALGESRLPTVAATVNLGALDQARDIVRNPQNPYHDRYVKGDTQVRAMVDDLYKKGAEQQAKAA